METRRTAALIPAAGTSARMGDFKPLLNLAGRPVIEQVITRFRVAGVNRIVVVVGHRAGELIPVVAATGARWVENRDFAEGMFSSIRAGLSALPRDIGAFFVLPADIPLFRAGTLSALMAAGAADGIDICYPAFEGRRGHPPLIAAHLRERILAWKGQNGLRGSLQNLSAGTVDVPVADEGILLDLDTPADYRRACRRAERPEVPTEAECLALMTMRFGRDAGVIRHCRAVTDIAMALAAGLNRAGCSVDPDVVLAAGLLHDVAKGSPDHAEAGARLLSDMGFDPIAPVVRDHMDLTPPESGPVDERELVYLADKLVAGDRPVALEGRFAGKLDRYGHDPVKRSAIQRRLSHAVTAKKRIEEWLQEPIESFLQRERR
jgi:putative nucleotidyltransferase with HDIG domain